MIFPGAMIFTGTLIVFLFVAAGNFGLSSSPENGGDSDSYERRIQPRRWTGFRILPVRFAHSGGKAEPAAVEQCEAGCDVQEFPPPIDRQGFRFLIAAVYRFSPLNYQAVRVINCLACTWRP